MMRMEEIQVVVSTFVFSLDNWIKSSKIIIK